MVTTAVSAPGKVLLAGGYLVLDRAYTGLVFGLDARIHVVVDDIATGAGVVLNEIAVVSPQFVQAIWQYGYRLTERDGGIHVTQLRADADLPIQRNPFVETSISYILSYISKISNPTIKPASITILADNDYYSTPAEVSQPDTASTSRFYNFGVPLSQAHKTGLGSSAALVTAISAALLTHYLPKALFDLSEPSSRRRLHNIAQAAHCAAQGKVGSGFDVASAVYGSCLYRRFSPTILDAMNATEPGEPGFASNLADLIDERHHGGKWDTEIFRDAVRVPRGLRLVMCDVAGGSQTPGMVREVLAWRKLNPEKALAIWTELHEANQGLARDLRDVTAQQQQQQQQHPSSTSPSTPAPADFPALRKSLTRIRTAIREMSRESGVPIEPPSQTSLLDACERLPGVIGGVVPGAGGYDAIALLIHDSPATVAALQDLFAAWAFTPDSDAAGGGATTSAPDADVRQVSMLGVRQDMQGVRVEDAAQYREWLVHR